MLEILINALKEISGSTAENVFLTKLTAQNITELYSLFIEAPESLLIAFSQLDTFQTLAEQAATIPVDKCCDYARGNRKIFAKYLVPTITSNSIPTYSDLLSFGECFSSVLPINYFKEINENDFLNYYVNLGKVFQPDENMTIFVKEKISTLASTQTSQETFVFETLSDLAMYYSSFDNLDAVIIRLFNYIFNLIETL